MNILFCAAEMSPMVKVGGLGDVIGSLTQVLAQRGHDVRVVLPLYGVIDRSTYRLEPTNISYKVNIKGKDEPASIWKTTVDRVQVYLIEHEHYFGPKAVYTYDDLDRFYYFSRALLELLRHMDWRADVLHCHDWHTGAAVSILKNELRKELVYGSMASVFTIHNLGYQGWFEYPWAMATGIAAHIPPKDDPLHPLLWRMMGLGIYYADVVSTVSESYAREILTKEYGEGLDPVLRARQEHLYGIVNGIDCYEYNPSTDRSVSPNYELSTIERKREVKRQLQAELGLPQNPDAPLLGYVGRLTKQKGVTTLIEGMERILPGHWVQLVALGQAPNGDEVYGRMLKDLEVRYPQRARVVTRFDDSLARRIYAGADIFVMPSIYEPCGLGQLIALRYGTIPVVRRTGGLADTVVEHPITGNGFVFNDRTDGMDMADTVERAIATYQRKDQWNKLIARAMCSDTSWQRASEKYEQLYQKAVEAHRLSGK